MVTTSSNELRTGSDLRYAERILTHSLAGRACGLSRNDSGLSNICLLFLVICLLHIRFVQFRQANSARFPQSSFQPSSNAQMQKNLSGRSAFRLSCEAARRPRPVHGPLFCGDYRREWCRQPGCPAPRRGKTAPGSFSPARPSPPDSPGVRAVAWPIHPPEFSGPL